MERAALIWSPDLAAYDLGEAHPLNPLRLTLSVELMDAFGILSREAVISPRHASESELLLVHSIGYIEAVREASDWGAGLRPGMGLGTEDNPVYPGMHDIAALTCGGSIAAIDAVLSGRQTRTFSIAGGMHHAHRSRAAGFSVYNDAAVAIAVARQQHPDLKVLYVDIDAHHGDGVQEAFASSADVLTVSIHESGLFAFPGTGFPGEIGYGAGAGFSANVPLPLGATDECFALAFNDVVVPLARAFRPDVIVAQLGVDAQRPADRARPHASGLSLARARDSRPGRRAVRRPPGRRRRRGLPHRRRRSPRVDVGDGRAWRSAARRRRSGGLALARTSAPVRHAAGARRRGTEPVRRAGRADASSGLPASRPDALSQSLRRSGSCIPTLTL